MMSPFFLPVVYINGHILYINRHSREGGNPSLPHPRITLNQIDTRLRGYDDRSVFLA